MLLNGIDTSTNMGFQVGIYANQYIKINYGTQEYLSIMDEQLNDGQWYGIIVNIGNVWNQYNVYVWEQHPTDSTTKLRIKHYETMRFTAEYVLVDKYVLNKAPVYMTNIRLYKANIEEEKQRNELLSYFVKDANQALILDNCDPLFRAPYISKQR